MSDVDEEAVARISNFVLDGVEREDVFAQALEPSKVVKAAKRVTKAEKKAQSVADEPTHDVRKMSGQQIQELALQNLVNELHNGSGVAASKELLSFTENVYVSTNADLEGMTSAELLEALDGLRVELQHIVNKESVGI